MVQSKSIWGFQNWGTPFWTVKGIKGNLPGAIRSQRAERAKHPSGFSPKTSTLDARFVQRHCSSSMPSMPEDPEPPLPIRKPMERPNQAPDDFPAWM